MTGNATWRVNGDNSLTIFGKVNGWGFQSIFDYYNNLYGWSLPYIGEVSGQKVSSKALWNVIYHIRNKTGIPHSWDTSNCIPWQFRNVNDWPDINGRKVSEMTWGVPTMTGVESSATIVGGDPIYNFIVPRYIKCMHVKLLLAGGGGGGYADGIEEEMGGWTARGGGSGAFIRDAYVRLQEGDRVTIGVGKGGTRGIAAGGSSGKPANKGDNSFLEVWRPSDNRIYRIFEVGGGGPGYGNFGMNGADWWKHYNDIGVPGTVITTLGDRGYNGNHTYWGNANGHNNPGQPGSNSIAGSRGGGGGARHNVIAAYGYGSGGAGAGYRDFKRDSTRWDGGDGAPGICYIDFLVKEPDNTPIYNITDAVGPWGNDGSQLVYDGAIFVLRNGTDPFTDWSDGDNFSCPETPFPIPNEANYVLFRFACSGGSNGDSYGNGASGAWAQDVCIDISSTYRPAMIRMKNIMSTDNWGYVNGPLLLYINDRVIFDFQQAWNKGEPGKIGNTVDWNRSHNGNGSTGQVGRNTLPSWEWGLGYGGSNYDGDHGGGPTGAVFSFYRDASNLPQGLNIIKI